MKIINGIMVATMALCIAGGAHASSVAFKAWNAEIDSAKDPALHVGASVSLDLGGGLRLSGQYLGGTFDDVRGVAGNNIDSTDADLALIYRANIFDIGIGGRYTEWGTRNSVSTDDFQIFGPMVYLGLGDSFGDSILGWYIGGSYMFKDFGDAYDNNWDATYEHYNVEGGLSLVAGSLVATVGYRIKDYTDSNVDLTFDGIAGSVGFGF